MKQGVEIQEAREVISNKFPDARFEIDKETYAEFKIIKLIIRFKDKVIQPMLFGDLQELANLNAYFWGKGSDQWEEKMKDISNRGTFLKRRVLIPKLVEELKKYFQIGDNVLELGCGEGSLLGKISSLTRSFSGLDISQSFIELLKKKFPLNRFYHQDIVKMRLKEKFNLVICSMVLLDIPQIDVALANIISILEEKGILIIVDINSRVYKALGYYEKNKLVEVHDKDKKFHTEKLISGHTKVVHNYHPFNYYKNNA